MNIPKELEAMADPAYAAAVLDDLDVALARVAALEAETQELKQAVTTILEGFDENVFVRNVDEDTEPGWAIRLAPYLAAIAQAQRLSRG